MALETLDYDYTIHTTNKGDEALLVKFYMDLMEDTDAGKKAGRPVFREVEYIDIRIPGNRDNVVVRPAREADKRRFPLHYEAFRKRIANKAEEVIGTPLTLWPMVSAAQIKEFEYFNVRTVEQLAEMPDSTAAKFPGIQSLKQKAAEYLEISRKKAPIVKLQAQLDDLRAQNEELLKRLNAMQKTDD